RSSSVKTTSKLHSFASTRFIQNGHSKSPQIQLIRPPDCSTVADRPAARRRALRPRFPRHGNWPELIFPFSLPPSTAKRSSPARLGQGHHLARPPRPDRHL